MAGKTHGVPVYQLLGGKTKERLPVYATSTRPDLSKAMGFVGGKFPLPYGPADGDAGMRANIERVKAVSAIPQVLREGGGSLCGAPIAQSHHVQVRASVGPDFPIVSACQRWFGGGGVVYDSPSMAGVGCRER